jgi:hypothetical protein
MASFRTASFCTATIIRTATISRGSRHVMATKVLGGLAILGTSVVAVPGSIADAAQGSSKATEAHFGNRQASLQDPAAQPGDAFGAAVSVDGSTAIIGADGTDDSAGAAYIYVKTASGWPTTPTATLPDPNPGPNAFGSSVAISGSYAIVGADAANSGAGAVYVYSLSGSVWSTTPTATISGQSGTEQGFGFSVSIYDGGDPAPEAIVGSSNETDANVYTGNVSEWPVGPTRYLSPEFGGDPGYSVGIVGDVAIVGAPHSNVTGFAYLYIANRKGWVGSVKTVALNSGSQGSTEFGDSVSTTGSAAIVGAMGQHNGRGASYVYSASNWSHATALKMPATQGMGVSVALGDKRAVIGDMANHVYVYKQVHGKWGKTPAETLNGPGGSTTDNFGISVSASDLTALIGAPGTDNGSGAAYLYHV